jgi:hypothetical protein
MSDEHKAALAQGRQESRAIKAYLEALKSRKPGRSASKEGLKERLGRINEKLASTDNPLEAVDLIQSKLDVENALAELTGSVGLSTLESGFIAHVSAYSERKGVTYPAWREFGVPVKVLRAGGIRATRRR